MSDANGMVDYLMIDAPMPCKNCTITFLQANLQYPDGSYANANTSLWLHHTVFVQLGKEDTVCGSHYWGRGQRWWASGNERTVTDLSLGGKVPAGYYLGSDNSHIVLLELMNQAMHPQDAMLSVTFEWVPGFPSDFYSINPMWLDIGGCGGDSDEPVKSDTSFHYDSPTYTADFSGAVMGTGAVSLRTADLIRPSPTDTRSISTTAASTVRSS